MSAWTMVGAATALIVAGGWPNAARAQPTKNPAAAEELFREGERLFRAGSTHEACEKFASSNAIDPAPGTLTNLAICHAKEGKTASAWRELNALADFAARAGKHDREAAARATAASLEKGLARVRIHVPPDATLISADLDGVPVNVADAAPDAQPFPADPGPHEFHGVDDAGRSSRVAITIPVGPGTTMVNFAFEPPTSALDAAPVPAARPHYPTLGWWLVGAGAAGLVAGLTFGILADTHRNDRPNGAAFNFATASDVAVVAGLITGGVGAGCILWAQRPPPPPPPRPLAWSLRPSVSVAGGGVQFGLGGAF